MNHEEEILRLKYALTRLIRHDVADELAKYKKGATIRISGELKANGYEKDGKQINGYQIVAEGIAGVKSATVKHQKDERQSGNQQGFEAQDRFVDSDLSELDGRI